MKINRLVLASSSTFRRRLLDQVGVDVACESPHCDESAIIGRNPAETAMLRARAKGISLSPSQTENWLAISADQVLEFQGTAYGKAKDEQQAFERLQMFAGQSHFLHSACALILYSQSAAQPQLLWEGMASVAMHMRNLQQDEIRAYLATGEWRGCAGSYQYENHGCQLFDKVEGDYTSIIGLPMPLILQQLRAYGINPLLNRQGPWLLVTKNSCY